MSGSTTDRISPNQVFLRGVLADVPGRRELPSGDLLLVFRLTVPRPRHLVRGRIKVDSLDCRATSAKVRRSLERASPGDEIELTGSLHRRFWRSPGGLSSRYEVEAATVRVNRAGRLAKADPPAGASRARKQASA